MVDSGEGRERNLPERQLLAAGVFAGAGVAGVAVEEDSLADELVEADDPEESPEPEDAPSELLVEVPLELDDFFPPRLSVL